MNLLYETYSHFCIKLQVTFKIKRMRKKMQHLKYKVKSFTRLVTLKKQGFVIKS